MTRRADAHSRAPVVAAAAGSILASLLAFAPPATAAPGDLVLASTSEAAGKNDGFARGPSISANGTSVAFYSDATNLNPADTDATYDVFAKNLGTGELVLASTSATGVKGNGNSQDVEISPDGSAVGFVSLATNLDGGDSDADRDVYVKDLADGDIAVASSGDGGVKGNNASYGPSLSTDGRMVAFSSSATNLDPADTEFQQDVYVKDLLTGDITLASTSEAGDKGNAASEDVALSADGGVVAFGSYATNFSLADTDAEYDIYVKDLGSGSITLASTSDDGTKANAISLFPTLSADGSTVAFSSQATNLDPADTDPAFDVYVKDLETGDLTLASTNDIGIKANGLTWISSLSADGTAVSFTSVAENLDAADGDFRSDIFVKDLPTGDVVLASSSSTGVNSNDINFESWLNADGSVVTFASAATNLDPADSDPRYDVYVKSLPPPVAPITVSITDAAKKEGNDGFTRFTYQVTLSAASAEVVFVNGETADGTAVGGTDYVARTGTLRFKPGRTTKKVVVKVIGDTIVEPRETFRIVLAPSAGAAIADGVGLSRIRNDD